MSEFERVCVIGLGYVGLPTAAVMANRGIQVIGVDRNADTVGLINQGEVHIVEPGLDILVRSAVASGKLKAVIKPEPADAFILAVPTPFSDGNLPDLSYLESAARDLAPVLAAGNLVILESTSPVGTTEEIAKWLSALRPDLSFPTQNGEDADIRLAHSPERVLPGRVLIELVDNDRVIGGLSEKCSRAAADLYKLFVNGACHLTDARTAELVKLAENAYRDTNIAFANEMSLVCEKVGVDVWDVIGLANRHPRVEILKPGPGVGGHCIAVDPWFIVSSAPDATPLITAARGVNDAKPKRIADQILAAAKGQNAIACLGLSYKADIDDLRESPAVEIVQILGDNFSGDIYLVEPNISRLPETLDVFGNLTLTDLDRAISAATIVALLTDHREFKDIDQKMLTGKTIFDTRGIWRNN